jgi:hypothetical protein
MEQQRGELARAPRRAALALVALVGLLGLVAIGSAGHTHVDLGGRRASYLVVDTVVSLVLVMLVLGVVVGAYLVIWQREYLVAQRLTKRRRRPFVAFGIALALVLLLLSLRGVLHVHARQRPPSPTPPAAAGSNTRTTAGAYKPRFATAPVLLVLGFAASVAFAAYLALRQRRRGGTPDDEASLALTLAEVLGDTLDDLRAEPDPRRAVIAAYARLERTLGAFGLPRRGAEAPEEYVHRIFVDLGVNSRSARRLTQLFARAKFSQHSVDQAMKEEAIQLLETIRTGLREADEHAREQRASIETTSPRAVW